jgi:hypothetical protein
MRDRDASATGSAGRRARIDWFLRDRSTGRIAVAQWPNPALDVWAGCAVVSRLALFPSRSAQTRCVAAGALVAWAADEIARGDSPFRRLLGVVVLGRQAYLLAGWNGETIPPRGAGTVSIPSMALVNCTSRLSINARGPKEEWAITPWMRRRCIPNFPRH